MNRRAAILILLMLLAQAAQAMAWKGGSHQATCGTSAATSSCCAWRVALHGPDACHCAKGSDSSSKQRTPLLPLPAQGREIVPQSVWALLTEVGVGVPASTSIPQTITALDIHRLIAQPHVRLSVLHGALLI